MNTSIIKRILLILLASIWMTLAGCGNVAEDSESGGTGSTTITGGATTATAVGDFATLTISVTRSEITVGDAITVSMTARCNGANSAGFSNHCQLIGGEPWFSARPTSRSDLVAGSQDLTFAITTSRQLAFSEPSAESFITTVLAAGTFDNPSTTTTDEFTSGEVLEEVDAFFVMNSTVKGKATITITFEDITATIFIDVFEDVISSVNP